MRSATLAFLAVPLCALVAAWSPAALPGTPRGQGSSGADLVLPVAVLVAVAAVAAYTYAKRRRRTATRTTPHGGHDRWEPAPARPSPDEPDARAGRLLADTDEAVRTSEEELGFALARLGREPARPFTEAVAYAKGELAEAFRLRQRLDEERPEDEATRRRTLEEIVARCEEAGRRLDAEAEAFDRLRALERTAGEVLAAAREEFRAVRGRADLAEAGLVAMRERYAESAAVPVAEGARRARERLLFASAGLERAAEAVDGGDAAAAAVGVRAAEGALHQAALLVDAVDRRARELAEAAGRLPTVLAGTEADLAEAGGLLEGAAGAPPAGLRGRAARAESVVTDVRAAVADGRYDPIDALRRVGEAGAALDEALAAAREDRGARRAGALLDAALLTAGSAVEAAADHLAAHRGAVGALARTRLAEAHRRMERARELAEGYLATGDLAAGGAEDAREAAAEARQADALARQALSLAEQDVRRFAPLGGGPPDGDAPPDGLGGAVLGGILLRGEPGGTGGAGGDDPPGADGGGGRADARYGGGPGRFGGRRTRGRLGGGDRFRPGPSSGT
ncbi:TPM domain-containing protein [Streptomyces sp. NPDC016309]|uniref:TPM domain-containing protein n=1 Tax=Streptomyces sp. NPDC016309 TaxID=3364965 RepID=UPI0036F9B5AB